MSTAAPISFAGSQLAETRHVCAFFNSDDEEYRVLLPFIKDGFGCGHKAVHVVNPELGNSGGDTVIDIMRTHPMVIIGEILHRNPFYVPPGELLREFRERRTGRSTSASVGS